MAATQSENAFDLKNYNRHKGSTLSSAPTQSLLQKWLRDKFHLDITIACNSLTSYFPVIQQLDVDGTTGKGPKYLNNYRTYKEALEVGLQEALYLIKI